MADVEDIYELDKKGGTEIRIQYHCLTMLKWGFTIDKRQRNHEKPGGGMSISLESG